MNEVIILGHENVDVDSIVSGYLLNKLLKKDFINSRFIIPDKKIDKESAEICIKYGLNPYEYQAELPNNNNEYFLVDHNEDYRINKRVLGIFDHHPKINEYDFNIPIYYNKKVSSTACFITKGNEEYFDDNDIKLALMATMVDTASFHSTKSVEEDHEWVKRMCKERNIDYDDLYKTGLCLTPLDNLESASLNGLKKYKIGKIKFESSFIQILNNSENNNKINDIINILKEYVKNNNIFSFIFIVHNMTDFKSTVYEINENGEIHKRIYDKYTSRGNEIIPEYVKAKKLKL